MLRLAKVRSAFDYLIILCRELLWSILCSGSIYFWNIILILVTLHRPCPVLEFAPVQSILRILFCPFLDCFVLTDPQFPDHVYSARE